MLTDTIRAWVDNAARTRDGYVRKCIIKRLRALHIDFTKHDVDDITQDTYEQLMRLPRPMSSNGSGQYADIDEQIRRVVAYSVAWWNCPKDERLRADSIDAFGGIEIPTDNIDDVHDHLAAFEVEDAVTDYLDMTGDFDR